MPNNPKSFLKENSPPVFLPRRVNGPLPVLSWSLDTIDELRPLIDSPGSFSMYEYEIYPGPLLCSYWRSASP